MDFSCALISPAPLGSVECFKFCTNPRVLFLWRLIRSLYQPKAMIVAITMAPTTEPATIPPTGTELFAGAGEDGVIVWFALEVFQLVNLFPIGERTAL